MIDSVVEEGRVDDERLVELYNAAELLLFPSFHEGFGWPPLEAMACGTPVVVAEIPALRETAGDAALYAAPADDERLAEQAAQVLGDPALAERLSAAGLERAGLFSWERCAAAYAELYRAAAAD